MLLSVSTVAINPTIDVVDANIERHAKIRALFQPLGYDVRAYATAKAYLREPAPTLKGCLLCNCVLPDMTGIELLKTLQSKGRLIPAMVLVDRGNVPMAVSVIRAGAVDVIENPRVDRGLVQRVQNVLKRNTGRSSKDK